VVSHFRVLNLQLEVQRARSEVAHATDITAFELPPEPAEKRPWEYSVKLFHDESIFYANDGPKTVWMEKGRGCREIRPKTKGPGIMVSDFIDLHSGWLRYSDDAWERLKGEQPELRDEDRAARICFEYGKNKQGYWRMKDMIPQLDKAIRIVEANHPNARGAFCFDNSSNHGAYAADALIASRMNVNPGGKQPKMRDGWYKRDGVVIHQPLCLPDGTPKGLKLVLEERGIVITGMKQEDMERRLSEEEDFLNPKPFLQVSSIRSLALKFSLLSCRSTSSEEATFVSSCRSSTAS
jgi:hypothetical protein